MVGEWTVTINREALKCMLTLEREWGGDGSAGSIVDGFDHWVVTVYL